MLLKVLRVAAAGHPTRQLLPSMRTSSRRKSPTHGEPDAVRVPRPVRRASHRNPPAETLTARCGPTSTRIGLPPAPRPQWSQMSSPRNGLPISPRSMKPQPKSKPCSHEHYEPKASKMSLMKPTLTAPHGNRQRRHRGVVGHV